MHITFEQAVSLLKSGQVAAVPTETVYGLAASLSHPEAIKRIFSLKGRPENNPLIIHLSSAEEIGRYVNIRPKDFETLTNSFWPGPLTIILPIVKDTVPPLVTASLPTAAFRIPQHPLTLQLLKETGPLVMPSANLSGKPSATSAEHVAADFGEQFPILDGGICSKGLESTIVCQKEGSWGIARLGALSVETFLPVLGYPPSILAGQKAPICPGQLYRHYAPKAILNLRENIPYTDKAIIGFSDRTYPKGTRLFSFGHSSQPEQASQSLYAILRQLDKEGISEAFVDVNFPKEGLWATLRERLQKARSSQE